MLSSMRLPFKILPMHKRSRVLVIGTTADYIDWIRTARPHQVVFITAPDVRQRAHEPEPSVIEEVLCDLTDEGAVFHSLKAHLALFDLHPVGVACFDCESLALAASIAERLGLSFPSTEAIDHCRDKILSKSLWQKYGIDCPDFSLVRSAEDVLAFFSSIRGRCVLKPVSGSGSELVYVCDSVQSCQTNFEIIQEQLGRRGKNRLYTTRDSLAPRIIAEECVEGEEYSCDFLLEGERVKVIRVTRKIKATHKPFGTTRAYIMPASLPRHFTETLLSRALSEGARALALTRSLCMADFIIRDDRIVFLEMTPRPGGDCLPYLLRRTCSLDILGLAIDFAAYRPVSLPNTDRMPPHVGVRLHAEKAGILKHLEAGDLLEDPGVLEVHFPRHPGHEIILPPADYDTWLLGHIIFSPASGADPESECNTLCKRIIVEIEQAPS